jgi:probable addiction module antidote protein
MAKIKARTEKLTRWDAAEHLKTEEAQVEYLKACLEDAPDDAAFIADALGVIARARGMPQLAKDTGLTREALYRALSSKGNPRLDTVLKVLKALGLRFTAEAA